MWLKGQHEEFLFRELNMAEKILFIRNKLIQAIEREEVGVRLQAKCTAIGFQVYGFAGGQ